MLSTFSTIKSVHHSFKKKCLIQNVGMSETLTKLMKLYSQKGEKMFEDEKVDQE